MCNFFLYDSCLQTGIIIFHLISAGAGNNQSILFIFCYRAWKDYCGDNRRISGWFKKNAYYFHDFIKKPTLIW